MEGHLYYLRGPNHYTKLTTTLKGVPCSINPPLCLLVHFVHMYHHRSLCTAISLSIYRTSQPLVAPIPTSPYYHRQLHLNPLSQFCKHLPAIHLLLNPLSFLMNTYLELIFNPTACYSSINPFSFRLSSFISVYVHTQTFSSLFLLGNSSQRFHCLSKFHKEGGSQETREAIQYG